MLHLADASHQIMSTYTVLIVLEGISRCRRTTQLVGGLAQAIVTLLLLFEIVVDFLVSFLYFLPEKFFNFARLLLVSLNCLEVFDL